jgi:phospholipid transport system substrate-binding protein
VQHGQEFATLVREGFDLELIGRFALGRAWKSASAVQQQEYQTLFALWTINTYDLLLGANQGGHLTVIGAQPIGGRDALVRTKIDRVNGKPVEIDLRVRDTDGHMRIVEVLIAGASMGVTQRDEFALGDPASRARRVDRRSQESGRQSPGRGDPELAR